jgi:cytochrome b561
MKPGDAMTFHISFGITILALIVLRFFWRITHPVAPPSSLPAWQQLISEAVHWLLYALVLATTMTGWIFASERGWSVSLFFAVPLPSLPTEGSLLANSLGKWHGTMEWVLLLTIGVHVAAAMAHTFIFRDRIMQRMLPEKRMAVRTKTLKPEAVTMRPAREARVS